MHYLNEDLEIKPHDLMSYMCIVELSRSSKIKCYSCEPLQVVIPKIVGEASTSHIHVKYYNVIWILKIILCFILFMLRGYYHMIKWRQRNLIACQLILWSHQIMISHPIIK
ncbi:hypothetical protein IEQ34_009001 [Dendrobium chrysotoxum]|uniref:Uncharacterized protein n=1 Tax=Dendrobium chrysotoxum TaxID=161865 RepID=A0AAV7GXH9_DENCH|nr:hypothetical protein IEQ34_009001 [Dendrobium chrysotoxum]